mgnify:CR=1 FL=1
MSLLVENLSFAYDKHPVLRDVNFSVEKGEMDNRTYTKVQRLDRGQRQQELARLPGGAHVSDVMLRGEEELLCEAENFKSTLG